MFSCKLALRILVMAMAVIMLMSVSAVSAREAVYNFNIKSPMNASLRSLMLPGWGQFFNEQPAKGMIFAGAELIAVGTVFMMYSSANSAYSDYETQRTTALYDDYSSKIDTANMFVYASAAIWVGNIIDAYLSADSGTSSKNKKSRSTKKSSKKRKVEIEEKEDEEEEYEENIEEDDEYEDEESRLPERGFYLQAKGLDQVGIAYRYTF